MTNRLTAVLTVLCGIILVANRLPAQEAARPPSADTGAEGVLAEIVVTAQKKSENLQKVPIAVAVLGAEELEKFDMHNLQDVAAHAPNVQMLGSNGDAQLVLAMRGVAQSDYSPNGTPAVALYMDEVYMGATPLASGVQMFDLERVEMLYGPQGTLYGRNTTGGAVNLISVKPKMDGTSGYFDASYGNFNEVHGEGAFDIQLSDRWGTRFAFTGVHNDGYVKDLLPNTPNQSQLGQWATRWSLLYRGDGFDATLQIDKSGTRAMHSSILIVEESSAGIGFTGYTRAANNLSFQETQSERVADKGFDMTGARLTVNASAGSFVVTSITSLYDGGYFVPEDADGSPWKLLEDDFHARTEQISQDLRLSSKLTGPFNFIGGVYYSWDRTDGSSRYRWLADAGNGAAPAENICSDANGWFVGCYYSNAYRQTRKSAAAYLNSTYNFTEAWKLTAGVRYTHDDIVVNNYHSWAGQAQNSFNFPQDGPPIAALQYHFINGVNDSQGDSNVSGKLGLDWQATQALLLYASYSTGYRGTAYNGFAFQPTEFSKVKPETLHAAEVGFKSTMAGGRIRFNGAAFHYLYNNQQFLDFESGVQTLRNAGQSRIWGGELQLTAQATDRILLDMGLGLLNAKYSELSLGGVNLSGNRLPSAPHATLNAAADYDLWSGGGAAIKLHYDGSYVSKQYFEPFNDNRLAQGGYMVHNARLNFDLPGERDQLGFYGKNLLNKDYAVYSVNLDAWNGLFFFRGLPRTYGLDYRHKF
jgi:iron complex outermembrane receptor protein